MASISTAVRRQLRRWTLIFLALFAGVIGGPVAPAFGQSTASQAQQDATGAESGPIRLRQSIAPPEPAERERGVPEPRLVYVPGEFERFVQRLADAADVRRFGTDLAAGGFDTRLSDTSAAVPADYVIGAGDEILLVLWGTVDADLRLTVDRTGRISIPRVGAVSVAGLRMAELPDVINRRVGLVFKNFQLSVSLGALRGVRVFVTGFVQRPGAYTVSPLSSVANAVLRAGGPTAAGSFRQIALRRGAQTVAQLDLYDFLLRGDRATDQLVQAGDVIHVGPVGPQAAIIGSVNRAAIFELREGETVADLLRMAGGFSAVADRSRTAVERLDRRSDQRIEQLPLPAGLSFVPTSGDVVRIFSAVDVSLPAQLRNKRVRIEGEVNRPGEYILPPQSSIADALKIAGGMTSSAFVFGAEFSRESVKGTQQENYERALRDLETELARNNSTQRALTADEATAQAASAAASTRLVERLRLIRPTGRVVLQLEPGATELPDLALEDGDRLFVPARPTIVGVFGSVFNGGSYLYAPGRSIGDYLRLAGGATRGGDADGAFVVRANGSVVSGRQRTRGWFAADALSQLQAEPGDTVFVPEEMRKTTFVQEAKEWTQILYQFGLGAAALKTLRGN